MMKILVTIIMLCGLIEVGWGIYNLDIITMANGACLITTMGLCILNGLLDEDDDNNN